MDSRLEAMKESFVSFYFLPHPCKYIEKIIKTEILFNSKCSSVTKVSSQKPLMFGKTKFLSQIGVDIGLCSGVLQARSSRANESDIDEPKLECR